VQANSSIGDVSFSAVYGMRKTVIRKGASAPSGHLSTKAREDPAKLFPLNEICRLYSAVNSQTRNSPPSAPLPVCAVLSLVDKANPDSGYLLLVVATETEVSYRIPIPAIVDVVKEKDRYSLNLTDLSPERVCPWTLVWKRT
jgi:hypothetical protein